MNLKKNFKKKILKNGMTILFEKRDLPIVSVAFAVRNGGVNEFSEEKGISHFIEHLLYKGTFKRTSKQIAEEIERNGGELNGFTSEISTAFWCKMPSDKLNIALDVLSDMIKNPLFDEKELEKERKVIFEEIKMYKDAPRLYVFDEIKKELYDKSFGIPLIGTYKTMNSINREKLLKKFKETYTPNNLILCVVGDANFNEIVDFVEKSFGEEYSKIPEPEIKLKNGIKIEKRKGIDQANLVFAYHIPLDKKSKLVAKILNILMAGGMSSRLFQEIREKRNLAYAVKGFIESGKNFGYNLIYVGTPKENVEKIKKLILEEFSKIQEDLTEKEIDDVKKQIIGNYNINMEDSYSQFYNLLDFEIESKAEDFYDFEKNISDVKLEDVKELAKKVKENNYSFFALVPEE